SNRHGAYAAPACGGWEGCHRPYRGLADGDGIRALQQLPKPLPVFFIRQCVEIGPHCLIDVDPQRSTKAFSDSRDIRQPQVVRLHHDRDDGYGHAEPHTTLGLLMDERPVSRAALRILLLWCWVIQRKLDVVEGAKFLIVQSSHTVTIGGDGELDWLCSQVSQYCFELRMHPVFARPQIYGADGKAIHD